MIAEIVFWVSLAFVIYTYIGYPIILYFLSLLSNKEVAKAITDQFPMVSVVIAARNEGTRITARIDNLLEQSYPNDKLEIIVVSDGSEDDTVQIVEGLANKSPATITAFSLPSAKGKPSALNLGVFNSKGEIIVFADARQRFAADAITHLVANFNDPSIGCVSGELIFTDSANSSIALEMGAYWNYEKVIRKLESKTGSAVGVTGAVCAVRREFYTPMPEETLLDDLFCPLHVNLQGKRVIFDTEARAYDHVSVNHSKEWLRKVRTLAGNWQLFSLIKEIKNPFIFSISWRFYSHKVARLIVPFLLPIILISSLLSMGVFYLTVFMIQLVLYGFVLLGFLFPGLQSIRAINISYFFFLMNLAALFGFYNWYRGHLEKLWK